MSTTDPTAARVRSLVLGSYLTNDRAKYATIRAPGLESTNVDKAEEFARYYNRLSGLGLPYPQVSMRGQLPGFPTTVSENPIAVYTDARLRTLASLSPTDMITPTHASTFKGQFAVLANENAQSSGLKLPGSKLIQPERDALKSQMREAVGTRLASRGFRFS
jgi:hypothetical protein